MSSLKERTSHKRAKLSTITEIACAPAVADPPVMRPAEVVIGRIVGAGADGAPIVDFPGNPASRPVSALSTACYDLVSPGQAVALMFISGDLTKPVAIGLVTQQNGPDVADACAAALKPDDPPDRLTLAAAREIVLQCGHASIVLTRAGKVLVRGAYLSLRSSGMQRITGASVHIN